MPSVIRWLAPLVLCVGGLGGCHEGISFQDDEGGAMDDRAGDRLSQPYVEGGSFNVTVRHADTRWTVTSSDPAVLAIESVKVQDDELVLACRAIAEGSASLRLVDPAGEVHHEATVSVMRADAARAFAHGPLRLLGRGANAPDAARVSDAVVLVGGTAVFAVGYYRGDTRLYGRGLVEADPVPGMSIERKTSSGLPVNEWLFVTPTVAGVTPIAMRRAVDTLGTIGLTAVDASAIASLTLGVEEATPNDGDDVWVYAGAKDAVGKPIYGAYASWTLDGVVQHGKDDEAARTTGDLYRYKYAPDAPFRALVGTLGDKTSTVMVKANEGVVRNTTYLGCSAAPGAPTGNGLVGLLLVAAAGVFVRRRVA